MPFLYKLYERLVVWLIIEHDMGIMAAKLADQQLGFRKGFSTSHAILKAVQHIVPITSLAFRNLRWSCASSEPKLRGELVFRVLPRLDLT